MRWYGARARISRSVKISCDYCGTSFDVAIAGEVGVGGQVSAEGAQELLRQRATAGMEEMLADYKQYAVPTRCPNCGQLQSWMLPLVEKQWTSVVTFGVGIVAVGMLLCWVSGVSAIVGGLLAMVAGVAMAGGAFGVRQCRRGAAGWWACLGTLTTGLVLAILVLGATLGGSEGAQGTYAAVLRVTGRVFSLGGGILIMTGVIGLFRVPIDPEVLRQLGQEMGVEGNPADRSSLHEPSQEALRTSLETAPTFRARRSEQASASRQRGVAATAHQDSAKAGQQWQLRLRSGKPSQPIGFEALVRLAREKRLKPGNIVRGPLTRRVWRQARHTPKLCRMFGVCHFCEKRIPPKAVKCPACGALIDRPPGNSPQGRGGELRS